MPRPGACALALLALIAECCGGEYYGTEIGALSSLHHGVRGRLYAVDSRTLYLRDFHYDGEGPAAYFYVGNSKSPGGGDGAVRLRDERGGVGPLRRYRGEGLTLALPDGRTLKDIKWLSVWCDDFSVNFGSAWVPRALEPPRSVRAGALRGIHGVSSGAVVVVDAQTLLVPNFSYDGEAPDAKFWVGRGPSPSPQGIRIPDEHGSEAPLRKYDNKTIVLTLPGELTVFDIGHFGVWCEAFTVDFGHVALPPALLQRVPPSLKMLGVSPQSKLNCEVLLEELAFEVRWAVAEDSVVIQLVAKLEDGEYMSFGISGDASRSQMVGGDVAVAWVDKRTLKGEAQDYYLDAKSQCAGVRGSCPDERLGENTNSVKLMNSVLANGYSIVTYQRTLRAADSLDRPVLTNQSQPVIWAVGPLNARNEVSYHHHFTKGDKFIEFGRAPVWNCPRSETDDQRPETSSGKEPARGAGTNHRGQSQAIKPNPIPTPAPVARTEAWEIPPIQCNEPPDGVFYAQMGPTGGKQGYPAITGHVGWGISWYINGLLIPELVLVRGRRYTFVTEGGNNPDVPARYHPFYITNDPVGGYFHKTEQEKKGVEIYAGVRRARGGELVPTGVGRLCSWTPDAAGPSADEFPSFGAYQRALTLVCEEGTPGAVSWTPDETTPDTVYYQCFTHRYLGWKIHVVDECDEPDAEESRVLETIALPPAHAKGEGEADLQGVESIQVQSRAKPDNSLDPRKKLAKIINTNTNYDNFSSTSGLTGEVYKKQPHREEYELPVSSGQIQEVIQTVESIESQMQEDLRRNHSRPQYQVHEDIRETFQAEQPVREDDEYSIEPAKLPESYFLPPNQKPLTLQSVLRPTGPKPPNGPNMRPPFRRPVPPEIKLRRPPPLYQKINNGYPLPMPNHHNHHGPNNIQKKPQKYPMNRLPPNMGRPSMGSIPPMKSMPPLHLKPQMNQSPQKNQGPKLGNPSFQSIIMGKPAPGHIQLPIPTKSQTLSLGQTDIIANQVVKSQITLPGAIDSTPQQSLDSLPHLGFDTIIQHSFDSIAQHNTPHNFLKPVGQIILGKPMDNPIPLDQQMTQNKPHMMKTPHTPPPHHNPSTTLRIKLNNDYQKYNEIKSSDFIGESQEASTLQPAVNTGFKPDSIVVESGFKPIIREPLMAGEDRITDGLESNSNRQTNINRREDTDVEEDYEESPQIITNHAFPSDRITQSFEPMFIPSPEDHMLPSIENTQSVPSIPTNDMTKEVFPKNHAKEDRPHPVYVKTETELNALFGKKNMEKEVPDMMMESDRVSPQYLPPDPKLPKEHSQKLSDEQTFTTYDGKTVSAASLTSVPDANKTMSKLFSSKLPANTALLLRTPQFGPFKGEIPPPVDDQIAKDSAKLPDMRTTKLKLVKVNKPDKLQLDDLQAHGSEIHEVTEKFENVEEEEEYEDDDEEVKRRRKRESKAAQFERGEVEAVRTNGHSLAGRAEGARAAGALGRQRLAWTQVVLLSLLSIIF